ncbi:MAG: DUF1304 domain-containing protein [Nannocystaceae bacterium]|nr:DUF1304 domain-containing protein [bacterium]
MLTTASVALVSLLHVAFAAGESVGWSRMAARFGYDAQKIEHTRALALNQGAYNLGIAAMLVFGLATSNAAMVQALLFFILAMAVVGATSVRWTIFAVQGVPALLALGLTLTNASGTAQPRVSANANVATTHDLATTDRPWSAPPRFET